MPINLIELPVFLLGGRAYHLDQYSVLQHDQ